MDIVQRYIYIQCQVFLEGTSYVRLYVHIQATAAAHARAA